MKKMTAFIAGILLIILAMPVQAVEPVKTEKGKATKTSGKVETPSLSAKYKTLKIKDGKFTTEKGKVVVVDHPKVDSAKGVAVEELKFKSYNVNDPNNYSDDTVVFIKDKQEIIKPIDGKNPLANRLKGAKTKKMKVYSTYNIMNSDWNVIHTEVLGTE